MAAKKESSRSTLTGRDRDKLYVQDIIDNCNKIKALMKGINYEQFIASSDKNERIAFRTQQIGEASSSISKELKQEFSDINWRELSLLRNLIVHAYFDMPYDRIWNFSKFDVEFVKGYCKKIMREAF